MSDAIVLAGAVAKGAFTAGALSVLSEPDVKARHGLDFTRIVGASSGALNGTFFAAALHAGAEALAGERLAQLWLDDATIGGVFDVSLRDIVRELGVSTEDKVIELLRRHIPPSPSRRPIELRLVVTNADGDPVRVNGSTATTFEHVVELTGADFETTEAMERVYAVTAASAALPGVFAPVPLTIAGRTIRAMDGGMVDDAPLGHALNGAPGVARIFVITPFPRVRVSPPDLHGLALVSHVLDMLIEERLVRDLRHVTHVNDVLGRLPALLPDPAQRAAVLEALGWGDRRVVELVEIRPDEELPGDGFSGFASRTLRKQYVAAGVDAARRTLATLAAV
jgi:predicted acylesterase/phospholipase RssA